MLTSNDACKPLSTKQASRTQLIHFPSLPTPSPRALFFLSSPKVTTGGVSPQPLPQWGRDKGALQYKVAGGEEAQEEAGASQVGLLPLTTGT